jgi:hypothetical protein
MGMKEIIIIFWFILLVRNNLDKVVENTRIKTNVKFNHLFFKYIIIIIITF